MSKLGAVVEAVEKHGRFVLEQVKRARSDEKFAQAVTERWNKVKAEIPMAKAPTGLPLPRLALPEIDEPGEIARYLFGDGLPGEFPYLNGAYREMYLEPLREIETGSYGNRKSPNGDSHNGAGRVSRAKIPKRPARPPLQEEPTRLFSGLMLAEDTNKRFHFLSAHQRSKRLSTAFDGPTLYGIDSDADGVFGKIGEGGVAVDTVEDMVRLYDGFEVRRAEFFRVDDDQRSGADHHGDVHRGREASLRSRKWCRICAARFRPTFSRKCRRRTRRFFRRKRRCVFFAT